MHRRHFITATIAGTLFPGFVRAQQPLRATPRDYTGPFYRVGERHRTNDLLSGDPDGKVLNLQGQILTKNGLPLKNSLIEIWQTDPEGRYNHPRDTPASELRNDFLYYGEAVSDNDGGFTFRTYVPGAYGSRPAPHIHYKLWSNRVLKLTSQIYFHELGGPKGRARSRQAKELQTFHLIEGEPERFTSQVTIVV